MMFKMFLGCCLVSDWSVSCSSHKMANGKVRKAIGWEEFRLVHYAGEVNYNVNGEEKTSIHPSIHPQFIFLES